MNQEERDTIIEVLCSQALADHLGDVRDAEVDLWKLLGVQREDILVDYDSAWLTARRTLERAGLPLPAYLLDGEDDDED